MPSNRQQAGRAAADAANYWFYGNFQKAFAYMENWPITVVQAPVNSEAEFTHDIPFRLEGQRARHAGRARSAFRATAPGDQHQQQQRQHWRDSPSKRDWELESYMARPKAAGRTSTG